MAIDQELESGVIWEPRVLWDIANTFDLSYSYPAPLVDPERIFQIKFDRYNFRNGGQYPIELRYMLVAPVGYALNEYNGQNNPPTQALGDYGACAAVIQKAAMMISLPNRQHYALAPIQLSSWTQEPAGEPLMRGSDDFPYASGPFGICRWDFDRGRRLVLPRNAACSLALGTVLEQPNTPGGPALDYGLNASIAFHEEGVGHGGPRSMMRNARTRWLNSELLRATDGLAHPFLPADGLGSDNAITPTKSSSAEWPGDQMLTYADYRKQETARDGHSMLTGFSVAIAQSEMDDAIHGLANPTGLSSALVAPLSLRTPCKAGCDAFSQENWWRDGAPLALVCPTITPAIVYELPVPITLHKGEHIELEFQVPWGAVIDSSYVFANYQIGVSFAGYAAIKG